MTLRRWVFLISGSAFCFQQIHASQLPRPRLVVLLIVDQMRADLLTRFTQAMKKSSRGENEGLLRLRAQGVEFVNARTASVPSVTAAGHATLCTGASASRHGIVGNSFFDTVLQKEVESTFDPNVKLVVTDSLLKQDPLSRVPSAGISARYRRVPALADVLARLSAGKARTISLSLKDRGAVFCSGQSSVGTYWYDYKTGAMVSSTAFTQSLPPWVNDFNSRALTQRRVEWKPVYPISEMQNLLANDSLRSALTVRSGLSHKFGSGFPYILPAPEANTLAQQKFFEYTPSANDYLVDFSLEAVRAERLGCASRDISSPCSATEFPDLLSISFSTPDLVGHTFGGESAELMDVYINLNKSVERLMKSIESKFGKDRIVFILASDHGVQTLPEVMQARGVQVGRLSPESVISTVETEISKKWGTGPWVETIISSEMYFNKKTLARKGLSRADILRSSREALLKIPGVKEVLSESDFKSSDSPEIKLYASGHDPQRSGDLKIVTHTGWLWGSYNAANHGTAYDEDTRIPMIFSGWNIHQGRASQREVFADDVVPTVLGLLDEKIPEFMTGRSLAADLIQRDTQKDKTLNFPKSGTPTQSPKNR